MFDSFMDFVRKYRLGQFAMFALTAAALIMLFGVKFGLAVLIALLVHEFGHVVALWRLGIPVREVRFMIVMAAVIPGRPMNPREEVYCHLMGPLAGFLLGLVALGLFYFTGASFWSTLAMATALLNLLNLLPVLMLDGGNAVKNCLMSLLPRHALNLMVGLSVATLMLIMLVTKSWIFVLFLGFMSFQEWRRQKFLVMLNGARQPIIEVLADFLNTPKVAGQVALRLRYEMNRFTEADATLAAQQFRRQAIRVSRNACDNEALSAHLAALDENEDDNAVEFLAQICLLPDNASLSRKQALMGLGAWLTLTAMLCLLTLLC